MKTYQQLEENFIQLLEIGILIVQTRKVYLLKQ